MAKITRQTFLQFGVNANAASDICEFGTPATGSPVYTNVIATLQANTAWTTGWAAETIASNRPFLEDMNAVCYVFAYMLAYLMEMGIPEYDASTTYYTNSVVQYGGLIYQSKVDSNTGNTPAIGANWAGAVNMIGTLLGSWVSKSVGTIYQAATDGFFMAYASISSTSSNILQILTDSASTPTTARSADRVNFPSSGAGSVYLNGFTAVKKGDYYEATLTNDGSASSQAYFIAMGS